MTRGDTQSVPSRPPVSPHYLSDTPLRFPDSKNVMNVRFNRTVTNYYDRLLVSEVLVSVSYNNECRVVRRTRYRSSIVRGTGGSGYHCCTIPGLPTKCM